MKENTTEEIHHVKPFTSTDIWNILSITNPSKRAHKNTATIKYVHT